MIIVCQKCAKRYHLDQVSLGEKGRKVRCVACGHVWFQEPEALASDLSLMEKPILSTPSPPPFFQKFWRLLIKILLVFGLIFGGFFVFTVFGLKNWIAQQIPQIGLFYTMIDSTPRDTLNGLEIRQIKVDPVGALWGGASEDGKKPRNYSFMIKGSIVNTSSQVEALPPLKIQLKGKCVPPQEGPDCLLQEWTHALSKPQILPGEVIQFEASVEHQHPPGASFFVSF